MHAYEQDASVAEDYEDVFANVVAERVEMFVCERTSDEVEGEVEVGLFLKLNRALFITIFIEKSLTNEK